MRVRGGRVVTPGGVVDKATLVFDGGVIAAIEDGAPARAGDIDCADCWIVPGFVDLHVHGAAGVDVLDDASAVDVVARQLPRHGVTAFCPTSVACSPHVLTTFLRAVDAARVDVAPDRARVLGAHLESNFINPAYAGAQPREWLCLPPSRDSSERSEDHDLGAAVLDAIHTCAEAVCIVTVAPELPGVLDLVARLSAAGHRVSLGHSAATYDEGRAAVAAGARHATHLFNRMPPMAHRAPGLAGAVLASDEVTCELVCDGHHVHPAMARVAVRAKGPRGVAAITDATACAGLPRGGAARLGGVPIVAGEATALLADGTVAGSLTTMDAAFRWLLTEVGLDVPDAVRLTAETPAGALARHDLGRLAVGAAADCVVLDGRFGVRQTWVAGRCVWNSGPGADVSPGGRSR